jgi:hypothetical protein
MSMGETTAEIQRPDERQSWEAARRIESWAGEIRVNRLRLAAIIIFYVRHLIDVYINPLNRQFTGRYHLLVTVIVLAWTAEVLWLHWALSQRRMGEKLKYIAVIWDLAMVTMLGIVAKTPQTPLMLLYFIVIASAPLRLSLKLVWVATLGAMGGYAIVLAYYAWYVIGFHKYYATPEVRISRSVEFIWLLSLGVAGLLAGQVVRQMRRLAGGYPVAMGQQSKE